jgi:hypothetical protein
LIRGQDPNNEISYLTHYKFVSMALKDAGVIGSSADYTHITHVGRQGGARFAELAGCTVEDIKRAGNWSSGPCEMIYLTSTPRTVLRALANFAFDDNSSYFIKRNTVKPPVELTNQIFVGIDKWIDQFEKSSENVESNMAARTFLFKKKKSKLFILTHNSWLLKLVKRI